MSSKVHLSGDAGIRPDNPSIVLIQHDSMILNHENDLINTMKHEQYHYITGSVEDTASNEIGAIEYQISQSEYPSTSNDYKIITGDYLYMQWQRAGIAGTPGHYKLDAYKKCMVIL